MTIILALLKGHNLIGRNGLSVTVQNEDSAAAQTGIGGAKVAISKILVFGCFSSICFGACKS